VTNKPYLLVSRFPQGDFETVTHVDFNDFNVEMLRDYRAVIIHNESGYRDIFKAIRRHEQTHIFCKPAFLLKTPKDKIIEYGREVVDGIIETVSVDMYLNSKSEFIDIINDRIEQILQPTREGLSSHYHIAVKTIQFLFTRRCTLKPVRFTKNIFGYSYPLIDILFHVNNYQQFQLLEFLKRRGLLQGEFVDRIHACNFCFSSYLNFREVCTDCGSADIESEDLVHHFSCGYVGPESDYLYEGDKICPKCHKHLRHIGVDYDQPSQIFYCHSCTKTFQEPETDSLCFNCGRKNTPDHLIRRDIFEFELTALGQVSAASGTVFSLQEEFGQEVTILPFEMYQVALNMEIERIKRYGVSKSSAARISFENYVEIVASLGEESKELSTQISLQINDLIRTSDVVSYYNDTILLFLLTETNSENAMTAVNRFVAQVQELVSKNLSIALKIDHAIASIDGKKSFEEIMRSLVEVSAKDE